MFMMSLKLILTLATTVVVEHPQKLFADVEGKYFLRAELLIR